MWKNTALVLTGLLIGCAAYTGIDAVSAQSAPIGGGHECYAQTVGSSPAEAQEIPAGWTPVGGVPVPVPSAGEQPAVILCR